jgi:hypothetical protein
LVKIGTNLCFEERSVFIKEEEPMNDLLSLFCSFFEEKMDE